MNTSIRMEGDRSRRRRIPWLAALALATLCAAPAFAGRPNPPSVPAGKIFYATDVDGGAGIYAFWKMNGDGSGRTPLPPDVNGAPSRMRHGAEPNKHYWFLSLRPVAGTFCDGTDRLELFAVRDDGLFVTPLNDDPNVEIRGSYQDRQLRPNANWLPGDTGISFVAAEWDPSSCTEACALDPPSCAALRGGIYTRPVSWDASTGNLVLDGPSALTVSLPIVDTGRPDTPLIPDINGAVRHDWDPTSSWVVYSNAQWYPQVDKFDLSSGAIQEIRPGGIDLSWSPAGNRIACSNGYWSETFNPEGSEVQTISDSRAISINKPVYSPSGTYMAHERATPVRKFSIIPQYRHIWRTTTDFANGTDLTPDLPYVILIGWSAD